MHKLTTKEYKAVFDDLYGSLCLFANKYVENIDIAKDIVQEVFIKIWEDKIEFANQNNIKSYLYTSVKNRALNSLNKVEFKLTQTLGNEEFIESDFDPFFVNEVLISEASILINSAIETLPNKCAQIIKLSIKGMSNSEIAEELHLSINTIKAQKKIAYKKLKPLLKEHFILIAFIFDCYY